MKEKKEAVYWNIKESDIDENILKQIKKQVIITRTVGVFITLCCAINFLFIMLNAYTDINDTLIIIFESVLVAIEIAMLVIMIMTTVKLVKWKKVIKAMQDKKPQSDDLKEDLNEASDQ